MTAPENRPDAAKRTGPDIDTAALRALAEAATPGEWIAGTEDDSDARSLWYLEGLDGRYITTSAEMFRKDAVLAATAVNNLIPLLDALDERTRERDEARAVIDRAETWARDNDPRSPIRNIFAAWKDQT